MKRCLVTGATGLIGSALLPLLTPRWEVHATRRQVIDLSGEFDTGLLPESVDSVVYLAQSDAFREFPGKASDIFEVNVASVARMLEYARTHGARRFVLASSGGVYRTGSAGLNEDAPLAADGNLGFYLCTKLCSEVLARNYAPLMSVVILRFFFVYGPGQKSGMLVPRLVRSVREGKPVTLQGADGVLLNPTHVSDAADAVARALELQGSHTINVAGPETLSLRQMCEAIGATLGKAPRYESQPGEPQHLVGDTAKMRELLVAPRVPFREGLRSMIAEH